LYPVYEYCQEKGLPIIAHCSPYNPVRFKGRKKELHKLLSKSDTPIVTKRKKRKELCSYFTHPHNYKKVLDDFKDLKICFAHFGSEYFWNKYLDDPDSEDNWFVIIKDMISSYQNLYSDISFTLNNKEFFPVLKVLLSDELIKGKVLFGSDYYMVETKSDERRFGLDLRAYIGEENFLTIATENPNKFLNNPI
jgi:predicted TIM-barrel fold metal-dependent hydrolase|tara:strand:- start:2130 stop:2708 length:579 start_codon:yes stop_codon:yes gene_type:complete